MKGPIYIAGKMRGVELYNFPAFDKAAALFREQGWIVISPAEMDRARGFVETMPEPSNGFLKEAILKDLAAIGTCSAIALLPGWETSAGVAVELALARFLHLEIYDASTGHRLLSLEKA